MYIIYKYILYIFHVLIFLSSVRFCNFNEFQAGIYSKSIMGMPDQYLQI